MMELKNDDPNAVVNINFQLQFRVEDFNALIRCSKRQQRQPGAQITHWINQAIGAYKQAEQQRGEPGAPKATPSAGPPNIRELPVLTNEPDPN